VATETSSELLISLSVPGTTITPVPITKLPNSSGQRTAGSRVLAAGAAADGALSGGRRSLHSLLDHLAWIELPAPAWLALDPGARTLLDVDTRADLERIRAAKGR